MNPTEAMRLAIEEGKLGAGFVSPNPLVGCVILSRDGNLIGRGHHQRVGEAHAEVNALTSIAEPSMLEGAHVFVTLEPCAHEGRTPSCAKALARLPIASVTYGMRDPNPKVSGQGAEILRASGKQVEIFEDLQNELEDLAEIFLTNMRKGRPFVALKVAISSDGMIARPGRDNQWISNEKSREHVQYLRGCYDAVVSGAETFLVDNPRLNSRDLRFLNRPQQVVLLDPSGRCQTKLAGSKLLKIRDPGEVYVVTGPGVTVLAPGVKQIELPVTSGRFPLAELLGVLRSMGVHSLFVEGGARTYAEFFRGNLVDRIYMYVAPVALPGGLLWSDTLPMSAITRPGRLGHWRSGKFGDDMFYTGTWTSTSSS